MGQDVKTVNFNDMPDDNLEDKFVGLIRASRAIEIEYISLGTHDGPIYSRNYTTCVAAATCGATFAGLSHYDLQRGAEAFNQRKTTEYKEYGKLLELVQTEGITGKVSNTSLELFEDAERAYRWMLDKNVNRIPASEYIPQLLNELKSKGEGKSLASVVVGGNRDHIEEVLRQLCEQDVSLLGIYKLNCGVYIQIGDKSVNLRKQRSDTLRLPDEFDKKGIVLLNPAEREIIINDPTYGLVNIQILDNSWRRVIPRFLRKSLFF